MARRMVLIGGLALALSVLLLTPQTGEARGYRGYYGGGYRGYYGGGYRGYGRGYYGWNNYGYRPRYNYGYGYPYGAYTGYYSYPSYLYNPGYPGYVPGYFGASYTVTTPESYAAAPETSSYQSFYPPASEELSAGQDERRVYLNVKVPADAAVWIEGQKTSKSGPTREFVSPPLSGDGRYTYTVKARWETDGKEVVQTKNVRVRPGETQTVDFRSAAAGDSSRGRTGADADRDDGIDRGRSGAKSGATGGSGAKPSSSSGGSSSGSSK